MLLDAITTTCITLLYITVVHAFFSASFHLLQGLGIFTCFLASRELTVVPNGGNQN